MSSQTQINGVELYRELTGESGQPLVMVHGSWVDHHDWDAVVPLLSRSYRVLTYDRRGHSRSERPTGGDSIHDDVADLAALIDELDLAPAHIVGNSLGGSIALQLAMERPEMVRSLNLHEPPLLGLLAGDPQGQAMLQTVNQRFAEIAKLLEAGDMAGGARRFAEGIVFGEGAWEHLPPPLRETITFNAPTFLDELHDPDAFSIDLDRLCGLSRPVLLTYGEQSPPFLPLIIAKLAGALPQAEQKTFSEASHIPQLNYPEQFAATVTAFITRVASGQPAS
jgi:pimeloyl-ACP methyl ester carboxylesterase